jgi:hypothetical protein
MRFNVILLKIIFIAVNIRIESEHDNLTKSFANPNKKHKLQDNHYPKFTKERREGSPTGGVEAQRPPWGLCAVGLGVVILAQA